MSSKARTRPSWKKKQHKYFYVDLLCSETDQLLDTIKLPYNESKRLINILGVDRFRQIILDGLEELAQRSENNVQGVL